MGVHEELAALASEVGGGVFDDAETFRAALDDYLDDEMATRGEINLLVDAVRLGVFRRLPDQMDNGADPAAAIDVLGDQLARDRGTSEARSARWALAALAYAVGRVGEDEVRARRAAMEEAPGAGLGPAQSRTRMPDVEAPPETTLAPRSPATVMTPDRVRERPGPTDDHEGRTGTGRLVAVVLAVVVLLVGAGLVVRTVAGGGEDPDAGPGEPTTTAPPFTSAEVVGDRSRTHGVRSERTYRMDKKRLVSAVALTNTTKEPVTRLWAEVVPKELATHVSEATFTPRYTGVIEADPIVYWRIRLPAGATKNVQWTTRLPEDVTPTDDYLDRVVGWHEEAVTAATPRIERELAGLAREGEGVIKPPNPDPEPDEVVELPTELATPETDPTAAVGGGGGGGGGGGPTGGEDDEPPVIPSPNRPPRVSLASKSTDERVSAGYTVNASDPDGDSWSIVAVSGAPAGIGKSGAHTLGGTVSHTATGVTVHKSNIRSRAFTVSVTVQDEHGLRASDSFTWTVRDTHRVMPRYIGCYGNGDCGAPDIGAFFAPGFYGCVDPSRQVDTVAKQSISPGTVVRWGSSATFWYVHASGHPAC